MVVVLTLVTPRWVYRMAITKDYPPIKSRLSIPNGSKVIEG